jgi:cytochrome c biogenesis protein CcmG, thiol:disulfide interchange protein DsbE
MRRAISFVSAAAGFVALCLAAPFAMGAAEVGQPAPALAAAELNGGGFDLGALRGKVVIINFWATWCVPCREEMPALDAFYRQHHGEGLEMIGISADRPRDRGDVVKVMQAFSYPAAMLGDVKVNGFGRPAALPLTYIVDAAGIVRAVMTPDKVVVTEDSLKQAVTPLLSGNHASR